MLRGHDHLVYGVERRTRLRGPNANAIKFPPSLCRNCNNARSAPFDEAYDTFTARIWVDPDHFRGRWLNWRTIFDDDAELQTWNLCRYYVKNFACRIAETGFDVPTEMVAFLNGAAQMPRANIVLYKDFAIFDAWRARGFTVEEAQHPFANRMHGPESPAAGPLQAFCAEVQDGPVGVLFYWDAVTSLGINFCLQPIVPVRDRSELPYRELHEAQDFMANVLQSHQDLPDDESSPPPDDLGNDGRASVGD